MRAETSALVRRTLAQVLAVPSRRVEARARLAGDLHADSLDLVEAMEVIESALRARGWRVRVPEAALASATTVGDLTDAVVAALTAGSDGGSAAPKTVDPTRRPPAQERPA